MAAMPAEIWSYQCAEASANQAHKSMATTTEPAAELMNTITIDRSCVACCLRSGLRDQ